MGKKVSSQTQRYYSTAIGMAHRAWNNIIKRASKQRSYAHVEIRMTVDEFLAWAVPEYEKWTKKRPKEKPSIDRIDSNGHYEIGNLRLLELQKNRSNNRRNMHRLAPKGTLHCHRCKQYLPREQFYERPSVPITATSERNHWSGMCKECTKEAGKKRWEAEHGKRPDPTGICQRCNRPIALTAAGKVSRAKHCESCRHVLWVYKDRETPPQVNEEIREAMRRKKEETGSVFDGPEE